jgi:hypothetical protein
MSQQKKQKLDMPASTLRILLPDSCRPRDEAGTGNWLDVDANLMRIYSGVARDLPADTAVWDLRHLLFDGKPVERIAVVRWLNLCYMSVNGMPFEQERQQQSTALSANELYQLLAFADAINSTKGPLVTKTCTAELEQLSMQVTLGGNAVKIKLDGMPYWFCRRRTAGQTQLLFMCRVGDYDWSHPVSSSDVMRAIAAEVAAQCEQLLLMAYKLQLDQLLQWLQRFIAMASAAPVSAAGSLNSSMPLLPSDLLSSAVYSARVYEAAGYTEQKGQAAWATAQAGCSSNLCLLRHASPNQSPGEGAPPPCLRPWASSGSLQFQAEVQGQGFAGFKPGSQVDVTLDITGNSAWYGPTVKIAGSSGAREFTFPVTLSIDAAASEPAV